MITHADQGEQSPLARNFLMAIRYYELIRNDPALDARLAGQVKAPEVLLVPFYADLALYQGSFRDAAKSLM